MSSNDRPIRQRFHMYVVDPLDFHVESTVDLSEYLKRGAWRVADDQSQSDPLLAILAARVARTSSQWDAYDDSGMSVGHDLSNDEPVFIFKQGNNGTTIIVSLSPLHLPGRCIFEQSEFDVSISIARTE